MKRIRQTNNRQEQEARKKKHDLIQSALSKNQGREFGITPEEIIKNKTINEPTQHIVSRSVRNSTKKGLQKNRPRPAKLRKHVHNSNNQLFSQQNGTNPNPSMIITPEWFTTQLPVDVSIIVPLFKSSAVIADQIKSWDLVDDGLSKEVIYVDDCCPHKSHQTVLSSWEVRKNNLKYPVGKIIVNKNNSGYGPACNVGARVATGKYLIFLNADCEMTENWVKPMIDVLKKDKSVGIVGNLQLNNKNYNYIDSAGSQWSWHTKSFQHIGRHTHGDTQLIKPYTLSDCPTEVLTAGERQMVTGACFAIPNRLYVDIEGYDESYKIGYWEDSDMNMKLKEEGYKIWFEPNSKIYHVGSHTQSGGHPFQQQNRSLFQNRWINTGRLQQIIGSNEESPSKKSTSELLKENKSSKVVGCVIACNEEEFLEASVTSASPLVDEWIIVVGGNKYAHLAGMCQENGMPTDSTLSIAKKLVARYGGMVIEPPGRMWKDKAEMRNAYASYLATDDWMFMLDGDEVYKERQLWRLTEIMKAHEAAIINFWLFWNNLETIGTGTWDQYPQERLIKWKKGYHYQNHLHVSDSTGALVKNMRPCWRGSEKLFYHYSWVRPTEKIRQKRDYYKYQSKNTNDTYVDDIFLKWREYPTLVKYTHPMGGGSYKEFKGIHPSQIQDLISAGKLKY